MADVFISYSRKDKAFVQRLDEALRQREREAWVDWEGIRPTEEFMQAIYGAIEGADTFVFVLSPDSVSSVVCGKEIAHAVAQNKRMVPIVAREVNATDVPEALAKLNWIFCRESDDFEQGTATLITALDTDLDWVRAHTRLLTRALEWEAKGQNSSFVLRGVDLRAAEQWLTEAGNDKECQPTPLQTTYIIASRKAAARRQRMLLGGVSLALVVAIVLSIVAIIARQEAKKQEAQAKNTSVQADFDVALLYRENSAFIDHRTLAHLARALRTKPDARQPREYLISLLRERSWPLPITEPLRHEQPVAEVGFSLDGSKVFTVASSIAKPQPATRVWDARTGKQLGDSIAGWAAGFVAQDQRIATVDNGIMTVRNVISRAVVGTPQFHPDLTFKVVVSPDGQRLILLRSDDSAELWNAASGEVIGARMPEVQAAQFSADGQRFVSSFGASLRVWDSATAKTKGRPLALKTLPREVAISANGERIATATDQIAQVWETDRSKAIGEPMRHAAELSAVSFSNDGRRLLTVASDMTTRVWNPETGAPVAEPHLHKSPVNTATFSPDGRRFLTSSDDMTARLWETETGRPVGEPMRHEASVTRAKFSADGRQILTTGFSDLTARMWDAEQSGQLFETLGPPGKVVAAGASGDGRWVVTISATETGQVWDTSTGKQVGQALPHLGKGVDVAISTDGRTIITTAIAEPSRIWDAQTGKQVAELPRQQFNAATASFSADGRRVVTIASETAQIWDAANGQPVGPPLKHGNAIQTACFSPDGSRLVTGADDWAGRIWKVETGEPVGAALPGAGWVVAASFSADGRQVVTGSIGRLVQVWDAETGKPVGEPMRHDRAVKAVSVSPDGRRIVSSAVDQTLRVWDTKTHKLVSDPLQCDSDAAFVSFGSDGRRVMIGTGGGVRLLDPESGKPLSELLQHFSNTLLAGMSADGRRVFTFSADQTVRMFDVTVDIDEPLPPWIPELAEALGERRFDAKGQLMPATKSLVALRNELMAPSSPHVLKGDNFWSRFGRWFFTRGPERTISPDSKVTVGELDRLRAGAMDNQPNAAAR